MSARAAARTATLVALPVAVLVGALGYWTLSSLGAGNSGLGRPAAVPSSPVSMAARSLAEPAASACRALVEALPETLRDRPRRTVDAGPEQNAAYGQPPLTLACGTTVPSYPPEEQLAVVSGVCWYRSGESWTTVDRTVPVTVRVPASYGPGGQWVVDLSPAIIRSLPVAARLPIGCTG